MPDVIDKVLVEQPFTIRPREGQGFGPVDVLGAEQVNVRVSLNRRNDLAVLTVEFNRGDIRRRFAPFG
jgi:hypothetical protein